MTYEYLCTACGHAWEAEQSISAAPLTTCPNCHQENAKRQVSGGAGFILKGGGWYADLYSSSSKKPADADTSKSSDTKPSTDAKSSSETPTVKSDTTAKADKGSSGSSGASGSGSTGTPTPSTPSGSKATGAASGA
jgi:putative FmdB family regulatory protein